MAAIPSFDEHLDRLEFEDEWDSEDADEARAANPFAATAVPLAWSEALAAAGLNLWEQAFAWLPDSDVAPPPEAAAAPEPKRPPPGDDVVTIARELGLREADTPEALHRARRKFMWQNHPDRRADISADLATRRVAIANMLVDRALAQFARRTGVRRRAGGPQAG